MIPLAPFLLWLPSYANVVFKSSTNSQSQTVFQNLRSPGSVCSLLNKLSFRSLIFHFKSFWQEPQPLLGATLEQKQGEIACLVVAAAQQRAASTRFYVEKS